MIAGARVNNTDMVKLLGCVLCTSGSALNTWKKEWVQQLLLCAKRLRPLPMTSSAKQRAWSSIVLARLLYSPWGLRLNAQEQHYMRNRFVGALSPSLTKGARQLEMFFLCATH
eukprot:4806197-Amphidinium_carterae.1